MIVRTSRKTETFIMIVVPLSSIKEFIAIEFIGSTAAYMIIKKITHVEVLAMAGSFAASVILKKNDVVSPLAASRPVRLFFQKRENINIAEKISDQDEKSAPKQSSSSGEHNVLTGPNAAHS